MSYCDDVYITRVIDGDTIVGDVTIQVLRNVMILKDQFFRLEGINAPEIKGEEKPQGEESRAYLKERIEGKRTLVHVSKKDKYGRWLATVYLEESNINEELIEKGYAERSQ